jgi:hypothetical protein
LDGLDLADNDQVGPLRPLDDRNLRSLRQRVIRRRETRNKQGHGK